MEKQCLIISVFNDGVYELALNHLTSLRNQNITNYMAFTTGEKTFKDFKEKGFNITFLDNKEHISTNFESFATPDFNKIQFLRYEVLLKYLPKYKYVWYLDVDTVVLDNINKFIPKDDIFDCCMQDDINMFCCGCMLFRNTQRSFKMIELIYKHRTNKHNDQIIFRSLLLSMPHLKVKVFNRVKFPNGLLFFDEEIIGKQNGFLKAEKDKYEAIPNKSPAFVHANFMVGNEKKKNAFKKYDLWFISPDFLNGKIVRDNIVLFGTQYGGFYYPQHLPNLNENSIIYCFGAGEDITHDVILSFKLNCPVYIFDPTPRAIKHVKYVKNVLEKKTNPVDSKRFGGGDPNYWKIILSHQVKAENIILGEYGLHTKDGNVPFYLPKNKEYVSCSISKIGRSNDYINVPVKTINTIMKELNHDHIDLLKIDIENIECDILEKMLSDKIYPTYLSVDFDLMNHNKERCKEIIIKLMNNGYKIIKSQGQDFSFVRDNKMKPHLKEEDLKMFYNFLDKSNGYFEYGSGGSTYQVSIRNNIKKIYSVESDIEWQNKLKQNIKNTNITYIFNEMCTQPNTWGNPGKNATDIQKKNYSNHIRKLSKEEQDAIDFVFIDGRFRVACCLKCYDIIKDDCLIAFDDFLNRSQYHIVLDYFDIVKKTTDNRMVILKKKKNMSVPQELIEKFELNRD